MQPACLPAAAADPGVPLPDLRLNEYADREGQPRYALREVLRVMSQQEAASLFRSADSTVTGELGGETAGGTSPGSSSGSSISRRQLLWQVQAGQQAGEMAKVEQQQGLGQQSPVWRFPVIESMVIVQPGMLTNWWHAMDDITQVAFRFCKYLGKCQFHDLRATSSGVAYFPAP
jgi:hypothetical protein